MKGSPVYSAWLTVQRYKGLSSSLTLLYISCLEFVALCNKLLRRLCTISNVLWPRQVPGISPLMIPAVLASIPSTMSPVPALINANGAECTSGRCGLPSGLYITLKYASCVLFDLTYYQGQYLRNIRNTRYGWVASPYPAGTYTRQEASSFAWRTNGRNCVQLLPVFFRIKLNLAYWNIKLFWNWNLAPTR